MKCWRIAQWSTKHETAESRKYGNTSWFAKPHKHDGLGYRRMVREKDRERLYAGWNLLLDISSRAGKGMRGWIQRDGVPLDATALSLMTGFEEATFKRTIEFFSSAEVGWLVEDDFQPPAEQPATPEDSPGRLPAASGRLPAASGRPANPAATPGKASQQSTVQYRTGQGVQGTGGNKNGAAHPAGPSRVKGAEVAASKAQFAALQARVTELRRDEDSLNAAQKADLRLKERQLAVLQEKQAAGDFS